jgi:hypothetical protein
MRVLRLLYIVRGVLSRLERHESSVLFDYTVENAVDRLLMEAFITKNFLSFGNS